VGVETLTPVMTCRLIYMIGVKEIQKYQPSQAIRCSAMTLLVGDVTRNEEKSSIGFLGFPICVLIGDHFASRE